MKTTWNLGLLYKSHKDPQIEKDVNAIVSVYNAFHKKWNGKDGYLSDEKSLAAALKDYEKAIDTSASPPVWYFRLSTDMNSEDSIAGAQSAKYDQILTKAWNKMVFFSLSLGKIAPSDQKKFLASEILKPYRYFLQKKFNRAKYQLSEPEEKLLNTYSVINYGMWVDGVKKQLGAQKISFQGKEMGLGEAAYLIPSLPRPKRLALFAKVTEKLAVVAPFAEGEINAVVTNRKLSDELRGYAHPYSSAIMGNQNDERAIMRMAGIVTAHFPVAHRFFKIKKQMMGISGSMGYVDLSAEAGKIKKKFGFEESIAITRKAFAAVDQEFSDIVDRFVANGQIDAFPRLGKKAGAYCWGMRNQPTFVLLNHANVFDSLSTLAHEMGHAIHTEYAHRQPVFYSSYTISTAEVASTLFENFAFSEVFETLSEAEKIIALHGKLASKIGTIHRQIALFNFEVELHETIRSEGLLAKEKISALMNKHLMSYIGKDFKLDPNDGLFWVRLSHIRSYFYMYTYAYGELVSQAMYANYKNDKSFVEKIKKFLSAGGSDTPENIFKSIGIDTTQDEFWISGLKSIEEDIIKLEKLVKNSKKAKKQA